MPPTRSPHRPVVLGVDSSTQSTKVVALDLETGATVAVGRAPHTGASVQDPEDWWTALGAAVDELESLDFDVQGISVTAQQHGLVVLDANSEVVAPASLWNDTAAAPDAARLDDLADFAAETGTRLVAAITIAKLACLARTDSAAMDRVAAACLPHDWLTSRLTGRLVTDRGDASGTGWWSPRSGTYRRDLLAPAIGEERAARLGLPEVLGPDEPAGSLTPTAADALGLPAGIPVACGTGDNMAAALGLGIGRDDLGVSLGTSGTVFALSDEPVSDPAGVVCGFADATGRYLPLACLLNCTRAADTAAAIVGLERDAALDAAATIEPGADGVLMLPFFDGERTPNLPQATARLDGLTATNATPGHLVRAALDGVVAGLVLGRDALAAHGIRRGRLLLVGGGAAHPAWRQAAADAFGMDVTMPGGEEHAARGVAIQVAALVHGATTREIAERWRPADAGTWAPRPGYEAAFRVADRAALAAQMRVAG